LEKSNALNLSIKRALLTGMQIDRVNASIASLDSLYLRELYERRIVAPSSFSGESTERIKGGFVMQSKPGIYEGIIVLDFKSLYPSIMRTFNIDPLSFVPESNYKKLSNKEKESLIESPNKAHFKNQDGILPIILERLWKQRDLAKKQKDQATSLAIKITMNSMFGVLANPTCRFYSMEMANAITHFGQFLNKLTAKKIEEKGYEVIYGDTDSIFVNLKTTNLKQAEKIGKELESYTNAFYNKYVQQYNRPNYLEIEFEKAFKKFLMPKVRGQQKGAKKRYAGLVEKNGKEEITFTGLEFVRRDWTEVSKKFQMELLNNIFHDKPIDDYVKNFVEDLRKGKMDDLLIYKKAIRKGVSEYTKTTPPHIKAARKLGREHPGIIEYVITINGPEPLEKNPSKLDYDHYIDKQIKPIADSILSFQDKTFDELTAKHKQMTLGGFG
jgi:DNA polymerase-2